MTTKKVVLGLVKTHQGAEKVVDELRRAGFAMSDISVLFPDPSGTEDFALEQSTKAPEGAITGASAGGVIGGTLGLLVGIGALAIPGFGPLIGAGPILAALSGMAAVAAVGGVAGALIGMGIPELEAKHYEGKVKDGHILVSVHVESADERSYAKQILEHCGATNVIIAGERSGPLKHVAA